MQDLRTYLYCYIMFLAIIPKDSLFSRLPLSQSAHLTHITQTQEPTGSYQLTLQISHSNIISFYHTPVDYYLSLLTLIPLQAVSIDSPSS